jgi:hypothetical protein
VGRCYRELGYPLDQSTPRKLQVAGIATNEQF